MRYTSPPPIQTPSTGSTAMGGLRASAAAEARLASAKATAVQSLVKGIRVRGRSDVGRPTVSRRSVWLPMKERGVWGEAGWR